MLVVDVLVVVVTVEVDCFRDKLSKRAAKIANKAIKQQYNTHNSHR